MNWEIRILMVMAVAWLMGACSADEPATPSVSKPTVEKTVAVVLPMEGGLETHWRRCLSLFASNLERAFKSQNTAVSIKFELYDESTEDLAELSRRLGSRDDVYAVVGGLYSSNASILTSGLTRVGKTIMTLATSEELVRAYASTGYLWAMTETDITQCEVLLSKVVNYGGASVALIAKDDDLYGKTFLDWFAFQARELGIDNRGVYSYIDGSLEEQTRNALLSGAEYVICVPSEIYEIPEMMDVYEQLEAAGTPLPRLLFSDTAYGTDVLSSYGEKVEGIEGVAFGADPESGFDISYLTFFGENPTTGEAQLYDAAMLLAYAAWYQHLHPSASLQTALRDVVSGEDINMGSWMGEDMSLVVDALARGDSPYVRGASGFLRFDKKIFTNVLATTYYNFCIYNGSYIILDYNTSDGGNRTDATLAGWNWKASKMQDFEDSGNISYPAHKSNWAVLIAASSGWSNYRHQADVMAIYQQLRAAGYPDSRIILIAEDDIAFNESNPDKGVVRIKPGGENLYRDIEVDYRLSQLSPSDLMDILKGEVSDRLPVVLESGPNDNVFLFWSGHGVPGAMSWNERPAGLNAHTLKQTLEGMSQSGRYRKMLMMVEACYSGGVMEQCQGIPGVLFITAANGDETSKADVFNGDMKVWMSNRFTSTFIEMITAENSIAMRDLYYRLFINTVGSHVMVYNAHQFGNLYTSDIAEFINFH